MPTRPEVKLVERMKLEDGRTLTSEHTLTPNAIAKLLPTRCEERVIEVGKQLYAALAETLNWDERYGTVTDGVNCLVLYAPSGRRLLFKPTKKSC